MLPACRDQAARDDLLSTSRESPEARGCIAPDAELKNADCNADTDTSFAAFLTGQVFFIGEAGRVSTTFLAQYRHLPFRATQLARQFEGPCFIVSAERVPTEN